MNKIHVEDRHMDIIREILKEHPDCFVFGSRARGDNKKFSDLVLCFVRSEPLSISEIAKLNIAFEESDLPFKVDIIDYNNVSEEFREVIDGDKIPFKY